MTSKYISNLTYEIYKQQVTRFPIQIMGMLLLDLKQQGYIYKYSFKNEILPKTKMKLFRRNSSITFLKSEVTGKS